MLPRWWYFLRFARRDPAAGYYSLFCSSIVYPGCRRGLLTDYQPKVPLRVYSAEGSLIGESVKRPRVVKINVVPRVMRDAIIAAGMNGSTNTAGLCMLASCDRLSNFVSGGATGPSTITMQVARNFFLSREKP